MAQGDIRFTDGMYNSSPLLFDMLSALKTVQLFAVSVK